MSAPYKFKPDVHLVLPHPSLPVPVDQEVPGWRGGGVSSGGPPPADRQVLPTTQPGLGYLGLSSVKAIGHRI